jgi:hypothetical protein
LVISTESYYDARIHEYQIYKEEDLSSYWMNLREGQDTGNSKREH